MGTCDQNLLILYAIVMLFQKGLSLVPLLRDPILNGTGIKPYAFSQFAKTSVFSAELQAPEQWNTCTKFVNLISVLAFHLNDVPKHF